MTKRSKIFPLGDRVLIKPQSPEDGTKTKSGIIIPDTIDREKPEQGTVIAVGEGRTTDDGKVIPIKIKVGDTAVFTKYGPDEINIDGNDYYILKEDSILAIIK